MQGLADSLEWFWKWIKVMIAILLIVICILGYLLYKAKTEPSPEKESIKTESILSEPTKSILN